MTTLQERLREADRQGQGQVWDTLRRIATELERLSIPYVVVGGIALQNFNLQRSTQAVDLLINSLEDLRKIHQALVGRGYLLKAPQSRHLRDEITRVGVEFLVLV